MKNADKLTRPILKASKEQGNVISHEYEGGLTKREAFAMAAMQGIVSSMGVELNNLDYYTRRSVAIADALLKELEKTQ